MYQCIETHSIKMDLIHLTMLHLSMKLRMQLQDATEEGHSFIHGLCN